MLREFKNLIWKQKGKDCTEMMSGCKSVLAFVILGFLLFRCDALRFTVLPAPEGKPDQTKRCITEYGGKDNLIMGTYKITDNPNLGSASHLAIHVADRMGNRLHSKQNIKGESSFVFTSPASTDFDVCFVNEVNPGFSPSDQFAVEVDLNLKIGYEAVDFSEVTKTEHLKPIEVELRKMDGILSGVVQEMEEMKLREEALRNTNESTFDRVKGFSIASIVLMICLGVYQILHIRSFLKKKKVI